MQTEIETSVEFAYLQNYQLRHLILNRMLTVTLLICRDATTAEKLRGPRFGSQHRGACPHAQPKARLCVGCGRRSPSPAVRVQGITSGKFSETQMLNPAFW